ncbi:hypothetical protein KY330_00325 [Candidatus Woesearchaeota archaeon]|nr:hypothetical protein [Candidatus Woesearchaeota archaeon]
MRDFHSYIGEYRSILMGLFTEKHNRRFSYLKRYSSLAIRLTQAAGYEAAKVVGPFGSAFDVPLGELEAKLE